MNLPDPPEWFMEACKEMWAKVLFEGFGQFPWSQKAQPWHPANTSFNQAFDLQPGIKACRQREYDLEPPDRQQVIREFLAKRNVSL